MFEKEERFLKKIVKDAYFKVIRKHKFEVFEKGEKDVVTSLDLKTEQFIINAIKKHFPNDFIVSEEFNSDAKLNHRCWIIDPIDGTINFSRGVGGWCIQMAFVFDGEVKCAAIFIPSQNHFVFASTKGAWCNGKPIHVNSNVKVENAVVCHSQKKFKNKNFNDVVNNVVKKFYYKIARYRMFGSCGVEFAFVACGKFDGNIVLHDTIWDYVPGMFICEQAGGFCFEGEIENKKIHVVFATKELCELFEKFLNEEKKHKTNV